MLVDQELVFANGQTISAAAAGATVVDLEQDLPADLSGKLYLAVVVQTAVTGTLQAKLQDCATQNGTFADCAAGPVVSAPAAGTVLMVPFPTATKRYVRAYFGGSPTAGKVSAFLTWGKQAWVAAEQAESITNAPVSEA